MEHERRGITSLDSILQGLRLGDNVVWQVDNLELPGFARVAEVRSSTTAGSVRSFAARPGYSRGWGEP
jgi:hypothetical protein